MFLNSSAGTSEVDATASLPYLPMSGIVGAFCRLDFSECLYKVHQWRHSSALNASKGLGGVCVGDGAIEDWQRRKRGSSSELLGGKRRSVQAEALWSGEIKEVCLAGQHPLLDENMENRERGRAGGRLRDTAVRFE
jgi:hypothetical protein